MGYKVLSLSLDEKVEAQGDNIACPGFIAIAQKWLRWEFKTCSDSEVHPLSTLLFIDSTFLTLRNPPTAWHSFDIGERKLVIRTFVNWKQQWHSMNMLERKSVLTNFHLTSLTRDALTSLWASVLSSVRGVMSWNHFRILENSNSCSDEHLIICILWLFKFITLSGLN